MAKTLFKSATGNLTMTSGMKKIYTSDPLWPIKKWVYPAKWSKSWGLILSIWSVMCISDKKLKYRIILVVSLKWRLWQTFPSPMYSTELEQIVTSTILVRFTSCSCVRSSRLHWLQYSLFPNLCAWITACSTAVKCSHLNTGNNTHHSKQWHERGGGALIKDHWWWWGLFCVCPGICTHVRMHMWSTCPRAFSFY